MNPFNKETIRKNTKSYTHEDQAFRALLGGIGTGNISLDSTGALCDFEMMNHPDKGLKTPYTFFSIWSRTEGEAAKASVLEVQPRCINEKALGYPSGYLYGLPRMESCTMETNYPFFRYQFKKSNLPLDIELEAFTPFIPLDERNSGIPGFRMKYTVTNRSEKEAEVAVCGTMYNFTGFESYDGYDRLYQEGTPRNTKVEAEGVTGIVYDNPDMDHGAVNYGSLALMTTNGSATCKPYWQDGGWWDGAEEFWQDFREDGELDEDVSSQAVGSNIAASIAPRRVGSISAKETLKPGESKEFLF